jgi:ornithine cyclodeaminase/alanine dehydrogenase-like protein (mu-crystallin family)
MIDLNLKTIQSHFDFDVAVQKISQAYIASSQGGITTPPVVHIPFEAANGDCHIKSGHIIGDTCFVIKIATGFYDNPAKGLPSSNGMMIAFSAETGGLVAILQDEGWLTDMRTGIGGALATRALACKDARRVLIVGTGLQCRFQAECLQRLSPDVVYEFTIWGRSPDKAADAVKALSDLGLSAMVADDLQQAVVKAEIIITTTPSTIPLIQKDWVRAGTHITAIGADSPGKQELATDLVGSAELAACDMAGQSLEHGEYQHAQGLGVLIQDRVAELGQILSGDHPGRAAASDITIADLTGIAAQDIAITLAVLDAAQTKSDRN